LINLKLNGKEFYCLIFVIKFLANETRSWSIPENEKIAVHLNAHLSGLFLLHQVKKHDNGQCAWKYVLFKRAIFKISSLHFSFI